MYCHHIDDEILKLFHDNDWYTRTRSHYFWNR